MRPAVACVYNRYFIITICVDDDDDVSFAACLAIDMPWNAIDDHYCIFIHSIITYYLLYAFERCNENRCTALCGNNNLSGKRCQLSWSRCAARDHMQTFLNRSTLLMQQVYSIKTILHATCTIQECSVLTSCFAKIHTFALCTYVWAFGVEDISLAFNGLQMLLQLQQVQVFYHPRRLFWRRFYVAFHILLWLSLWSIDR